MKSDVTIKLYCLSLTAHIYSLALYEGLNWGSKELVLLYWADLVVMVVILAGSWHSIVRCVSVDKQVPYNR